MNISTLWSLLLGAGLVACVAVAELLAALVGSLL
jgi:hypothetical protein